MTLRFLPLLLALATASHAEPRELCPDRPGKATPACTLDPGRVEFETSFVDWTHDVSAGERTDTIVAADSLVRIGLGETTEAQFGWTAYGHVRTRDVSGAVTHGSGIGDATLAIRQNLRNPDGSGVSVALEPFVTLPIGHHDIGDTTWSAGLIVPFSAEAFGQAAGRDRSRDRCRRRCRARGVAISRSRSPLRRRCR